MKVAGLGLVATTLGRSLPGPTLVVKGALRFVTHHGLNCRVPIHLRGTP